MDESRKVILRDLFIFQIKLVMDGLKDIVLSPVAITAAAADMLWPGERTGHRFYAVMMVGERFDRWLNLFGAADQASAETGGLFGASRAGSDTMLGRLESMVLGRDEAEEPVGGPVA